MFREDEDGKKMGVLRDWDLAFIEDCEGHRSHGPDARRTGTLPFMAIDLLEGKKPHLPHHDIESILWLLVFVTSEYEGGSMTNPFNEWGGLSMKLLATSKGYFLHGPHHYTPTDRYKKGEEYVQALIDTTASHHKQDLGRLLTHDDYLEILENPLPP